MGNEVTLQLTTLYAFLVVLARISGALVFVPIPNLSGSPEPVRIILVLTMTLALYPVWPVIKTIPGTGIMVGWLLSEAAMGITIGLVVSFIAEAFGLFGQMIALNSGHSFASTVDPTTQADSGIFVVMSQSIAGLLFFTTGMHRQIIRILARSLETQPPGSFALSGVTVDSIIRLSSTIFTTGLRLAFPVIGLLVMIDLTLALLGRINAHLQLNSMAFPAKILATLLILATTIAVFPRVYQDYASRLFTALPELIR
jgi:flagellar biosynthesis protein FliR